MQASLTGRREEARRILARTNRSVSPQIVLAPLMTRRSRPDALSFQAATATLHAYRLALAGGSPSCMRRPLAVPSVSWVVSSHPPRRSAFCHRLPTLP
jgi:hypothetical protein